MFNPKVGDTVYVIEHYTRAVEAYNVTGLEEYPCGMAARLECRFHSTTKYFPDLFPTKAAAIKHRDMLIEAEKEEYRKQITDVPSLIQFMFDNAVASCEEYTDWEARNVAREKAFELLGLKLGE